MSMHKKIMVPLLIMLCVIIVAPVAIAQKTYIWCPMDGDIAPKTGLKSGMKVSLVVNDNRQLSSRSKDKCAPEELVSGVARLVRQTFPTLDVTVITSKEDPKPNDITIRINIMTYEATYSIAMWHASVEYAVKIADNRKTPANEKTQTIVKNRRFENALGFTTAKHNLSKTYWEANNDLVDFIYSTLANM